MQIIEVQRLRNLPFSRVCRLSIRKSWVQSLSLEVTFFPEIMLFIPVEVPPSKWPVTDEDWVSAGYDTQEHGWDKWLWN